ncbi:MAG: DUF2605 domain-containing protein [Cyanophyceae cyanobacterium]
MDTPRMSMPLPSETNLLKAVLEPLLEDFQHWFGRSRSLLESEQLSFLSVEQQHQLLERVCQAQQEVNAAQIMFRATGAQVGVETRTIMPWHQLLTECWQVAMRYRAEQAIATDPTAQ